MTADQQKAKVGDLSELIRTVLEKRPKFEIALAIGKFNNEEYPHRLAEVGKKRVYWWWCWGNSVRDNASARFPNLLNWQTIAPGETSATHGKRKSLGPAERVLAGSVTSYDPGIGFGNPWNGYTSPINWKELAPPRRARNFDPYTIPYFLVQYSYRERTWSLNLSETEFVARLQRRLFDADAPSDAGRRYWELSQMALRVYDQGKVSLEESPNPKLAE